MLETARTSTPRFARHEATMNESRLTIVGPHVVMSQLAPSEDEMRASYLRQYRLAAERGEISFVKYWRLVREMDRATLASLADLCIKDVEEVEKPGGPSRVSDDTLRGLAHALRVPIEFLA